MNQLKTSFLFEEDTVDDCEWVIATVKKDVAEKLDEEAMRKKDWQ